jgi:hypothetical protein
MSTAWSEKPRPRREEALSLHALADIFSPDFAAASPPPGCKHSELGPIPIFVVNTAVIYSPIISLSSGEAKRA